jgi:hypothetical protein
MKASVPILVIAGGAGLWLGLVLLARRNGLELIHIS